MKHKVEVKWPTTDAGWCAYFRELDSRFGTDRHSPLHHDNRCPIHNPNHGNGQPISPADGIDCAWQTSDGDVSSQDWFATVDELVEVLRRFLA